MLVFKPVIVGRRNEVSLTEPKCINPVEIDSAATKETVTFVLPAGFVVDEMPEAVNLETGFGEYTTSCQSKEGKLVFTRLLTLNRATVALDKYGSVKDFFAKMLNAEQSPVVLIRK